MSSMLEQAILDAKELKEAAIKNAQQALIEKYSNEFEGEIEKLLEQAAEPAPATAVDPAAAAPALGAAPAVGMPVTPGAAPVDPEKAKADSDAKSDIFKKLDYSFKDGEVIEDKVYPTGVVEIDLDSLSEFSFEKNQRSPEQMALQELKNLSRKSKLKESLEEEMNDDEDYDEDSDAFPYDDEEEDLESDEDDEDFEDEDMDSDLDDEEDMEDIEDEESDDFDIEDEEFSDEEDLEDEDLYGTEDDVGFHIDYDSEDEEDDEDYNPDADVEDFDDEESDEDDEEDSEEDEEDEEYYYDDEEEDSGEDEEDESDEEDDEEDELEEIKRSSKGEQIAKKLAALTAALSTMVGPKEQENIHKSKKPSAVTKELEEGEKTHSDAVEEVLMKIEALQNSLKNKNIKDASVEARLEAIIKSVKKLNVEEKKELKEAIKLDWKRSGPRSPWNGMFREEGEHDVMLAELQAQIAELEQETEELKESNKKLKNGLKESIKINESLNNRVTKYEEKLLESRFLNYKLLYTNKALTDASLNERQKNKIAESISNAKTAEEVKLLYETLKSTMRDGTSSSSPKSLSEAVERRSSSLLLRTSRAEVPKQNDYAERMKKLAGLA